VLNSIKPYKDSLDIMPSVFKHTLCFLSTLAKAYGEKFSEKTYKKYVKDVENFKSRYSVYNPELWIDSGGYNFVKGEYSKNNVDALIDRYHRFLKEEFNSYDKIFSLDLPLKAEKKTQYAINKKSIENSLAVIKENDAVKDKMYFVGQFLRNDQYEVWNKLYREFELYSVFKNRAIGGMVSSRRYFRNVPSPFIGIAYRYLFDFLKFKQKDDLIIHFLGIYLPQDRFTIILLEKLFFQYLKNVNINFSYDTISFSRKIKLSHTDYKVYFDRGSGMRLDPSLYEFNRQDDLKLIYKEEHVEKARDLLFLLGEKRESKLKRDLDRFMCDFKGEEKEEIKPGNLEILDPLGVYINRNIDMIMSEMIDRQDIVNKIVSLEKIEHAFELIENFVYSSSGCIEYSPASQIEVENIATDSVFSSFHFLKIISYSIYEVLKFHLWFTKNQDDEKMLDNMNIEFIKQFNKNAKETEEG
jgi:hypothetical protein